MTWNTNASTKLGTLMLNTQPLINSSFVDQNILFLFLSLVCVENTNYYSGLCQGCVLGTFSTLKSGMSPIILAVRGQCPHIFEIREWQYNRSDPRKVTNVPIIFNGMGHLSPFLQGLGRTLTIIKRSDVKVQLIVIMVVRVNESLFLFPSQSHFYHWMVFCSPAK